MLDCCLRQIQLTAASVSRFPWAVLKGQSHKLNSFITVETLSLAGAPFGFELITPHVNQLML